MKTKKLKIYRQGDVLIEQVSRIPQNAIRQQREPGNRVVLAYGEATGHHHSIETADIDVADWWKSPDGKFQYLALQKDTDVKHQEHKSITLPPGNYRVRRQREYTPEAIRNVAD
jgi:hypothetical protein